MELAIDTATRFAGLALTREGQLLAEAGWRGERNHTVELTPRLQELLGWVGAYARELRVLFVATGPGGFSALRVGLSTAKGMAEALDVPLVGVGTLEIEAFPYRHLGVPVCPMVEAGRGEVAWAVFEEQGGEWGCSRGEQIGVPEDVCGDLPAGTLVCGEAVASLEERLRAALGERGRLMVVPPPTRRAFTLAQIGAWRLATRGADDRAGLLPQYLRRPSVTPPRDVAGTFPRKHVG